MSTADSDSPPLKLQESTDEPPEPLEQVEPSSVQQEPSGPLSETETSLSEQEQPAQPSEPPKELEPSGSLAEAPIQPAKPSEEVKPSVEQEAAVPPPAQNQAEESILPSVTGKPVDVEITTTSEPTKEATSSLAQAEAPAQPSESLGEAETSGTHLQSPVQPPEYGEELQPSPTQKVVPPQPSGPLSETETSLSEQEQPAQPSEPPKELEPSGSLAEAPIQPAKPSEEVKPSTPVQLTEPPMEVVPQSPVQQEMTISVPGQDEVQYPTSPSVTFQPLDLELTITTETTTGPDLSPIVQETPTQPPEPPREDVTAPTPDQDQVQHPIPHSTSFETLGLELTVNPEPTTGANLTTAPAKPTATLKHPDQNQAQHPNLSQVTVRPFDVELTPTPEPSMEAEYSTIVKTTTAPPPKHPEVTLPHPVQNQAQHPNLNEVTVQPLLEITKSSQPTTEVKRSSMQETSTQPPKPAAETKIQPSTSGQDQAQHPTLAVTEANNTTTPPPQHPEVTPPHSEQLQSGLERTTIAHSVNPTTESALTVQTEPNATPYTNICELCTCRDESLLCVGLSPTQKLRRVPVPKPNTYKKVLTTLSSWAFLISPTHTDCLLLPFAYQLFLVGILLITMVPFSVL
uniref:Leucine-rich repeat-containing protein 37 N-terminal domain-containing protein n=1 Tax=Castor canadensis TaxID=51338 RepID=A0A8C0ZLI3_CASCN